MPLCNCGFELVEDDMAHVDEYKKPRCESCRDELEEAGVEPGEDDDVHSTCCCECEESFEFDEPVDALDYRAGKHEQRCEGCRENFPNKDTIERRKFLDKKLDSK